MDLSIVIPVLNEASKVRADVEAAAAFLLGEGLDGEVIVVDDGSTDGTSVVAQEAEVPRGVVRRVIYHTSNHGKGFAVRSGMAATRGDYVMFADSGLCVPFKIALRGLELLRSGACDVAHGSRKLPESAIKVPQVWYRRLVSRLFRCFVGLVMGIPRELTDTQCGFKMYRGDVARELYAESRCEGFSFDVEVLLLAVKKGYRVIEFPVEWRNDPDTRLGLIGAAWRTFAELMAIRRSLARSPEGAGAHGAKTERAQTSDK